MQEKKIRKVQKVSYTISIVASVVEAFAEFGNNSEDSITMFLRSQSLSGLKDALVNRGFIQQTTEKHDGETLVSTDLIVARPETTKKGRELDALEKETAVESWRDIVKDSDPAIFLSKSLEDAPRHLMLMLVKRYVVFDEKKTDNGSGYIATAEILVAKPAEK